MSVMTAQNNKMNIPLVSVVIATYRRTLPLKKALESLAFQTYQNIEIIVGDDNATSKWNEQVEVIIRDGKQQIKHIKNETNQGSAETRNVGIRKATGKYITFLDDDDIYLPNKIKNQVEHMMQEESDYSITDLHLYDENDRLIEKRNRKYLKQNNQEDLLRYHLMHHMTGTDTIMFKREYLLDIGGFPLIDVGDEFYLMHKAIEAGGIFSYLPVCDIKAYVHSETDGLSSGESKIKGENELYEYKQKYIDTLSLQDQQYIVMRHFAVLAFAEMRRRCYGSFMKYALKSFFSSPINCARLFMEKK
jgi:glycosyltransferase involved in cell wall biosynthesis